MQSLKFSDPVMVYHPDRPSRKVWRVDLNDYLAIGWSLSPVVDLAKVTQTSTTEEVTKEVEIDPQTRRRNELSTIVGVKGGWEEIKAIAAIHNINQKPKGGWDEAIDLILAAEFPEVAA